MKPKRLPRQADSGPEQETASPKWEAVSWVVALGGFALAMWLSCRSASNPASATLRTPGVLLVDALLASALAIGYVAWHGALDRWVGLSRCIACGVWAAAAFRLVPPMLNEAALFKWNEYTPDVPYVLLGAALHGGIAWALASPLASRALDPDGRTGLVPEERVWHLGGATILMFFIVAAVVRVLPERGI